jgi:hypothetical protein
VLGCEEGEEGEEGELVGVEDLTLVLAAALDAGFELRAAALEVGWMIIPKLLALLLVLVPVLVAAALDRLFTELAGAPINSLRM